MSNYRPAFLRGPSPAKASEEDHHQSPRSVEEVPPWLRDRLFSSIESSALNLLLAEPVVPSLSMNSRSSLNLDRSSTTPPIWNSLEAVTSSILDMERNEQHGSVKRSPESYEIPQDSAFPVLPPSSEIPGAEILHPCEFERLEDLAAPIHWPGKSVERVPVAPAKNPPKTTRPKRIRKIYMPKHKEYIQVRKQDVLALRGSQGNAHLGNRWYVEVSAGLHPKYKAAITDADKESVAQELIEMIRARGGRFLREDEEDPQRRWYEMHPKEINTKVKQKLRTAPKTSAVA